jgi:hypothetical protein
MGKPVIKNVTLLGAFILLILVAGCVHYSVGSGTSLTFNSIYVAPVKNDSFAPQAQALLGKQIRKKLDSQPNLEIAMTSDNAAVLEITIVNFEQSPATMRSDDTAQARSFKVTMTVICTLSDAKTGKIYFKDHCLSSSVECYAFDDNCREGKYQIMPRLTEKLADNICEIVCQPW